MGEITCANAQLGPVAERSLEILQREELGEEGAMLGAGGLAPCIGSRSQGD